MANTKSGRQKKKKKKKKKKGNSCSSFVSDTDSNIMLDKYQRLVKPKSIFHTD